MKTLYGDSKFEIQQKLLAAQKLRNAVEYNLEQATDSLKKFKRQTSNAYQYSVAAHMKLDELEKAIDALAACALDFEALCSKYYDEEQYLEFLKERSSE